MARSNTTGLFPSRSLAEFLHGGPVSLDEVERVRDTLVFDSPGLGPKLFKFIVLLVLASCIATYGLLGDSVAVVIGAMIVAPLMLPIMGLAFSVSVGDQRAIGNTLVVSLLGIVTAVAVGFLLTLPIAQVTKPEAIQQIMIRTAPHLLDLMAALMTGLAGAFALARKDVSDTLPGVAIAVSLVPPLANAGILFAAGEPGLASGSLLLFGTKLRLHPSHRRPGVRGDGLPPGRSVAVRSAGQAAGRAGCRHRPADHRHPPHDHQPSPDHLQQDRRPHRCPRPGLAAGLRLPADVGRC
jgi:uncharacterized hydrophobic protein (TIGR00271 family)